MCTAIYFLLQQGEISALHRINSGELWHFHAGSALRIHAINPYGGHSLLRLGSDIAPGEQYWIVFSTGSWFGANFEMGIVDDPLARCPDHGDMVRRMTKVQWID